MRFLGCVYMPSFADVLQYKEPNEPDVRDEALFFQARGRVILMNLTCHSLYCIKWNSNVNKNPTRCNSMQIFIYSKVTLNVSGVTAPIIRCTKNCNRSLRYRS